MRFGRFMFTPPWRLTRWGFLPEYLGRLNRGNDGVDGGVLLSRYVVVPFVGQFCWFDKKPDLGHFDDVTGYWVSAAEQAVTDEYNRAMNAGEFDDEFPGRMSAVAQLAHEEPDK